MFLKVIGSGSSGNTYIIGNDTEQLVIEAGIRLKEVKKALDFNITGIKGCLISHEHLDHSKYYAEYDLSGIQTYKPYEIRKKVVQFGNFTIYTFDLVHNVPCFGFLIKHPELGTMLYASDTEYIKYTFSGINHFLIEANYTSEYLERCAVNKNHVLEGHMCITTTCDFLKANNNEKNPDIRNVILCHLSDKNGDPIGFKERAEKVVDCKVYIAEKGLVIDI